MKKLTAEQGVEQFLDTRALRNLEATRRIWDMAGWIDQGEAQDQYESPGDKVGVIYPEDCTPTWLGLETPTSIDHALFLRSRCRYLRDCFREDMRRERGMYLMRLEAV